MPVEGNAKYLARSFLSHILLTLRNLAMYPCTVRDAQFRSITQRSNTETETAVRRSFAFGAH
jgi:hypothetical protein